MNYLFSERSTVGYVAQADITMTHEFGCRVVYIDCGRAMVKV